MQHQPRHFRPAGAAGIGARIIIGAGIIAAGGAACDTRQTKRRDDQIKPNATSVCVIGVLHTAMETSRRRTSRKLRACQAPFREYPTRGSLM